MEIQEKTTQPEKLNIGQEYKKEFNYSQAMVNEFARISGDNNPIHIDPVYAATTIFKKPIMHGMIGAGAISSIIGTRMVGSIYMSQNLSFRRPMYVDNTYEAVVTVKEINTEKHIATLTTNILEKATGKPCLIGEATILNKELF
jgi:acyl dehydratase